MLVALTSSLQKPAVSTVTTLEPNFTQLLTWPYHSIPFSPAQSYRTPSNSRTDADLVCYAARYLSVHNGAVRVGRGNRQSSGTHSQSDLEFEMPAALYKVSILSNSIQMIHWTFLTGNSYNKLELNLTFNIILFHELNIFPIGYAVPSLLISWDTRSLTILRLVRWRLTW